MSALQSLTANRRTRAAIVVTAVALMLIEYSSAPVLAVAPEVSRIDHWLAHQPASTIVELRSRHRCPATRSTGSTCTRVSSIDSGCSTDTAGLRPSQYFAMRDAMAGFPDDRSVALLRERQVDLVALRGEAYQRDEWEPLIAARARPELSLVTILPFNDRFQAVFSVNSAP
jgi:hypothetical protein